MRTKFVASLMVAASLTACGGGGGSKSSTPPPPPVVDTTPPDTTINSKPPAATTSNAATFTFSASEAGATLETSLDGVAYATATSPANLTGLAAGTHTFAVRARDAAGNVDPSPATYTWGVDLVPPSARIAFPTPVSYSDATSITVRGNANDAYGVSAVSVNGVAATSTDGFQTWKATVPLTVGHNSLVVSVTDNAGNIAGNAAVARVTNHGPLNFSPRGLAYDPAGDRVISADYNLNRIYEYRLGESFARTLSPTPGAANSVYGVADFITDTARNRLLLVDYTLNELLAVDLATGARTVIGSSAGNPAETQFTSGSVVALDTANNRVFVGAQAHIVSVDLATGARALVASNTRGAGVTLASIDGIVYDNVTPPNNPMDPPLPPRLLISWRNPGDARTGAIVAVDPLTGDRTDPFVQWPNASDEVLLLSTKGLQIDAAHKRLYTFDQYQDSMVAVDLTNGDKTAVAGELAGGTGPELGKTQALTFDAAGNRLFALTGNQIVSIDLTYGQQNVVATMTVGRGFEVYGSDSLAIEQPSGTAASLLSVTHGVSGLMRIDLASGTRTDISDGFQNIGTGPPMPSAAQVVVDTRATSNGHTAFVIQDTTVANLLSVDLITGNRTQIADLNASSQPVRNIRGMSLDAGRNRVLFTDVNYNGDSVLYAVDLASGARSTIAHNVWNGGSGLYSASNIALEPAINPTRAFVSDYGNGGIYAFDLATGSVSTTMDPFPGVTTQGDNVPGGMFLDTRRSRIVANRLGGVNNVFSVSLPGGAQQIISGDDPAAQTVTANGPPLYFCVGFDVNAIDNIAFSSCYNGSIIETDLVSGDRVVVAH